MPHTTTFADEPSDLNLRHEMIINFTALKHYYASLPITVHLASVAASVEVILKGQNEMIIKRVDTLAASHVACSTKLSHEQHCNQIPAGSV